MTTLALLFLGTTLVAVAGWAWESAKSASLNDQLDVERSLNEILREEILDGP